MVALLTCAVKVPSGVCTGCIFAAVMVAHNAFIDILVSGKNERKVKWSGNDGIEGVLIIFNRGTGYETSPWKQWRCNSCWKGRDPAQSFVLTFTPQLNILTKTFRLVSCSNTCQILLLFVQGQGQKGKQKHTTKKFVRFHNHCLWLTMLWWMQHKHSFFVITRGVKFKLRN